MDRNAFITSIFQREYPVLTRLAYRLTGDKDLAEDLCQDTFFLAILHYDELVDHPSPGGWLTLTLLNLVRNARQKAENRFVRISVDEVMDRLSASEPVSIEELLPMQLSKGDRQILIWRFEFQLDYQDIAERLGISEGAARARLFRALKRCKWLLHDHT